MAEVDHEQPEPQGDERTALQEAHDLEPEETDREEVGFQREQDGQENARWPKQHETEPQAQDERVTQEPELEPQIGRAPRLDESEPDTWNSLSSAQEAELDRFDPGMEM
jgi:hypothetical protein